jgi:hypothetical protein
VELLFVIIIATGIGFIIRYSLGGRDTHGMLLLPAAGAAATAITWVALLWFGFTFDGGWIWTISLVVGGLASLVLGLVLPRNRREADRALLTRLSGGRA